MFQNQHLLWAFGMVSMIVTNVWADANLAGRCRNGENDPFTAEVCIMANTIIHSVYQDCLKGLSSNLEQNCDPNRPPFILNGSLTLKIQLREEITLTFDNSIVHQNKYCPEDQKYWAYVNANPKVGYPVYKLGIYECNSDQSGKTITYIPLP